MSTIADIRDAWTTAVFESSEFRALTTAVYGFDIPNLESAANSGLFYFNAEINFVTFVVSRIRRDGLTGAIRYEFPVRIRSYRQTDALGDNFQSVVDRLETVDSLVRSELGRTWSSTVDYYEPNERGITAPELIFLEGRPTWLSETSYLGVQTIST